MHRRNKLGVWNRILGFVVVLSGSGQGIADIALMGTRLSAHLKGLDRVLLEFEQYDVSQQLIQRGRLYLVSQANFAWKPIQPLSWLYQMEPMFLRLIICLSKSRLLAK